MKGHLSSSAVQWSFVVGCWSFELILGVKRFVKGMCLVRMF